MPDPRDGTGRPVSAIHQKGCGTPDTANIHIRVVDHTARISRINYEYEVSTATPLHGRSDFYAIGAIRDGAGNYKTVIGPIEALPANTAGGTITITIQAVNTDGRAAPKRRIQATLLPCR